MVYDFSLMYVTDHRISGDKEFFDILQQALSGGVTIVQLREKYLNGKALYDRAMSCKALCDKANVPLVINDRVDIALSVDAAGVHLGQSDLPIQVARHLLGDDKIIGLSVSNLSESLCNNVKYANYLGLSPLFNTQTKTENLAQALGLQGLTLIKQQVDLPIVSIGGIDHTNALSAYSAGSNGIAVVSAISQAQSPELSTLRLKQLCQAGIPK